MIDDQHFNRTWLNQSRLLQQP